MIVCKLSVNNIWRYIYIKCLHTVYVNAAPMCINDCVACWNFQAFFMSETTC